jgi:DNA-binding NarL/FixJ family response regulator
VEALEAGSISGSDVLVLDLGRTIVHSLEAYLEVREGGSNPKAIIVARNPGGAKATVNPLRSVSVTGCLFKPFDPEDLLAIVSDLASASAPPQPPLRAIG